MAYIFHNRDIVLEFSGNCGSATVSAESEVGALRRVREIFGHTREVSVQPRLPGEYLIQFKVAYTYRLATLHTVERVVRRIRTAHAYEQARYLDRYIVASLALSTGKTNSPASDCKSDDLETLRKAAVVAREVAGILQFVDWDIAIANYLELNSKTGHKSRVIRTRVPKPSTSKRLVARNAAGARRIRRAGKHLA